MEDKLILGRKEGNAVHFISGEKPKEKEVYILCGFEDNFMEVHESFVTILSKFVSENTIVLVEDFNEDNIKITVKCLLTDDDECVPMCNNSCMRIYMVYKRIPIKS